MQKLLNWLSESSGHTLKYGVAFLMLSVILYPKFPFLRIPGVQVSVRLEDFVLLGVFLLWFFSSLNTLVKLAKDNMVRLILLFFGVGLISTLYGIYITETVVSHIGFLHWARRVEYMVVFFIGLTSIKRKEDLYFYLKTLLIILTIVFFYGIGQKYFNVPVITTQNEEYSRGVALRYKEGAHLVSTFAGHYDLASFTVLILPFLYLLLTASRDTLKKFVSDTNPYITRGVVFIVTAMSLWLLVQTASRISIVSYLVSSVLALVLMQRKKFIPLVLFFSFIFASFSSNLVDRYLHIIDVYAKEVVLVATPEPMPVIEDRSTSIRLDVEWPRAIRAFQKNPLTGTGYSSITLATDNGYLRALGETGALGFVSLMLILGSSVFILFKKIMTSDKSLLETHFVVGIFAATFGIMINMVFIDILEASKFAIMFWLLIGFSVYISRKNG